MQVPVLDLHLFGREPAVHLDESEPGLHPDWPVRRFDPDDVAVLFPHHPAILVGEWPLLRGTEALIDGGDGLDEAGPELVGGALGTRLHALVEEVQIDRGLIGHHPAHGCFGNAERGNRALNPLAVLLSGFRVFLLVRLPDGPLYHGHDIRRLAQSILREKPSGGRVARGLFGERVGKCACLLPAFLCRQASGDGMVFSRDEAPVLLRPLPDCLPLRSQFETSIRRRFHTQ